MSRPQGFTLVSAIFLMVVLAILAVSLVTLSSVQHTTSAQQIQATRAGYAVRAGAEWVYGKSDDPGGCPAGATDLALAGALADFTVRITCSSTAHTVPDAATPGATKDLVYYFADVTATSGHWGGPDYVRRRAEVKVLGP